jgi:hypothetical protein
MLENTVTGTHIVNTVYICTVVGTQWSNVIQDVVAIQNHPQPCKRNCMLNENLWQTYESYTLLVLCILW